MKHGGSAEMSIRLLLFYISSSQMSVVAAYISVAVMLSTVSSSPES